MFFFSAKGGKVIDDGPGFTSRFRFGETSAVSRARENPRINPRPRKNPQNIHAVDEQKTQ